MAASDRPLTLRAVRDWWTKGLLPRPQRRGLGRGVGSQTFWLDPEIVEQAKAVYDLLARHSRTYTAIIGLWLWGFPVDVKLVRTSYLKLIDRRIGRLHSQSRHAEPSDFVGAQAARIARKLVDEWQRSSDDAPVISDFVDGLLSLIYGLEGDFSGTGLAQFLQLNSSYEDKTVRAVDDCKFEIWARYLRKRLHEWISFPTQRQTLLDATDYDLERGRRVIRLALGCLVRLTPLSQRESLEELRRGALIGFGRPMLLILVKVAQEPLGQKLVNLLLRATSAAKRAPRSAQRNHP
jgi:hypothetical protein